MRGESFFFKLRPDCTHQGARKRWRDGDEPLDLCACGTLLPAERKSDVRLSATVEAR